VWEGGAEEVCTCDTITTLCLLAGERVRERVCFLLTAFFAFAGVRARDLRGVCFFFEPFFGFTGVRVLFLAGVVRLRLGASLHTNVDTHLALTTACLFSG